MITSTSVLSPSQPLRCTAKDLTMHWQLKTTAVNVPPSHCALLTHVVVISVADNCYWVWLGLQGRVATWRSRICCTSMGTILGRYSTTASLRCSVTLTVDNKKLDLLLNVTKMSRFDHKLTSHLTYHVAAWLDSWMSAVGASGKKMKIKQNSKKGKGEEGKKLVYILRA